MAVLHPGAPFRFGLSKRPAQYSRGQVPSLGVVSELENQTPLPISDLARRQYSQSWRQRVRTIPAQRLFTAGTSRNTALFKRELEYPAVSVHVLFEGIALCRQQQNFALAFSPSDKPLPFLLVSKLV